MLFDTNNLFKNLGYDVDINNFNLFDGEVSLFSADEGFLRGNMFKNLYDEYKNYTPYKIDFCNEKEKLLFNVQKYDFALNDLSLYLDLHPENEYVFNVFKDYIREYEKAKNEYIKVCGPLMLTETLGSRYDWLKNPWPWDKEGHCV